ncbi:hypothetical protein RD792_017297 [Penstemon davidsonii]|uniref:RING-type domain-containing protein n=1 Tax=Penstemon davidsonii TaxID=160366 RepID=A0ABR0CLN3_9LAMI|nr:hypothetical protein RD792_017297 [Penstemon davidsonii]
MSSVVREKHIRTTRRARSGKPEPDNTSVTHNTDGDVKKSVKVNTKNNRMGLNALNQNLNSMLNPNPNLNFGLGESGLGYCTEEQLEEILLKNLEFLYNEAINKLVSLGYDDDVALKAILRNGHCYGGMDVLTNILHNSLAYLNSGGDGGSNGDKVEEPEPPFSDLRQLEEYSLAGMVCLLQQVKPHLSKGAAMWCLLMSDLHVGRASVMEIPVLPSHSPSGSGSVSGSGSGSGSGNGSESDLVNGSGTPEGDVSNGGPVEVMPALCRFHRGWGFGNGGTAEFPMNGFLSYASEMALQREIEYPKRFELSPSMKSLLKRNVAMFAAGFRSNYNQSQACPSSLFTRDSSSGSGGTVSDVPLGHNEDAQYAKTTQEVVNSTITKFKDLNLHENSDQGSLDQKDEMILILNHKIKELEKQVKDRKEWAHQKAMQAARRLSNDLTELKVLRMEREETRRLKEKKPLEEATLKKLSEMEIALRKASGQVDRANAAVRKLEIENAEIKAEMEASKLSASESVTSCWEIAKREKKYLKKLLAWEKQKAKMQEDIAAEEQKISELQQELAEVEAATKEAEAKWRQEQKAKELDVAQLEEERRLKEASEGNNKRRLEALRLKIEIDFQRHKDDLQRLEQEYARLKEAAESTEMEHQAKEVLTENSNGINPQGETIASNDRECMICLKDEVSVVFLPCAHQVICASCNENYEKKGKAICPYCRVPIEQRILVYGASS